MSVGPCQVCLHTDRAGSRQVELHLELAAAAAVRLGWVGWLLFSAVAILRASTKEMPSQL